MLRWDLSENVSKAMNYIADFIKRASSEISEEEISRFLKILTSALANKRKIMVAGAGRSGLVAKSFAMRLMQVITYL